MAMFDWYKPAPSLTCPNCGSMLREWQGKDGPNGLFVWEQGRTSPIDQPIDDDARLPPEKLATWRLPSSFRIHAHCDCGKRVEAEGTCRNGTWVLTRVDPLA